MAIQSCCSPLFSSYESFKFSSGVLQIQVVDVKASFAASVSVAYDLNSISMLAEIGERSFVQWSEF